MIRIRIDAKQKKKIEDRHYKYFDDELSLRLDEKKEDQSLGARQRSFLNFLYDRKQKLIIGKPDELSRIIKDAETMYQDITDDLKLTASAFKPVIKEIFDYDKFSRDVPTEKDKNKWGAYQLVITLGISACPYCNRQYISTYFSKNGRTRAALDHFFDKATYPYLSLSLYNLVPCCNVCNSSFKGQETFSLATHMNPYLSGFEKEYKFSVGLTREKIQNREIYNIDFFYGTSSSNNFEIELKPVAGLENDFIKQADGNIQVFKIDKMYALHKDYVLDIIKNAIVYNETRVEELWREYGGTLFKSKEDVLGMILTNYVLEEDLSKRVLSKLSKDISEELGLLFP
ncbi:hypothetical protein [Pelosinus sp. sgz500959]|uniref:hypothetical protein n=1 Tax=Pelosinus sp. sgz500959 TaxID=3242472 RepID=UPI0036734E43